MVILTSLSSALADRYRVELERDSTGVAKQWHAAAKQDGMKVRAHLVG